MLGYIYKEIKTNKLILGVMLGLMLFFNLFLPTTATGDDKPEGVLFYVFFFIMSGSSSQSRILCKRKIVQ